VIFSKFLLIPKSQIKKKSIWIFLLAIESFIQRKVFTQKRFFAARKINAFCFARLVWWLNVSRKLLPTSQREKTKINLCLRDGVVPTNKPLGAAHWLSRFHKFEFRAKEICSLSRAFACTWCVFANFFSCRVKDAFLRHQGTFTRQRRLKCVSAKKLTPRHGRLIFSRLWRERF